MKRLALLTITALALVLAACGSSSRPLSGTATAVHHPLRATAPTTTPASGSCHINGALPDANCTPGAFNPAVTQATIHQTICKRGYTRTIRPPLVVTERIKVQQFRAYGLTIPLSGAELDHLVSLELGGAPASVANLWPEPYQPTPGAHEKDLVENYLHDQVCAGRVTLAQAQQEIAGNWLGVYDAVGPAILSRYKYGAGTPATAN